MLSEEHQIISFHFAYISRKSLWLEHVVQVNIYFGYKYMFLLLSLLLMCVCVCVSAHMHVCVLRKDSTKSQNPL